MPNQKLLEVISCLSKNEKRDLLQFVQSPYYNAKFKQSKILLLLEKILETGRKKKRTILDKQKLSEEFFPDKVYKLKGKNPIDTLASDLFKLVQDFIVDQNIRKTKRKDQEYLSMAKFYLKNGFESRFWRTIEQYRAYQKKIVVKDASYYHHLFLIEEEIAKFRSMFKDSRKSSNLIAVHQALDNYYLISKLEYLCFLEAQQGAEQEKDKVLQASSLIISQFNKHNLIGSPFGKLNIQIMELLKSEPDTTLLDQFLINAKANRHLIAKDKYRNIMAFYRYFIGNIYRLNSKGEDTVKKLFTLYREHLEEGFFDVDEEGSIMFTSLMLMTNFALKVNEVQWAKQLIFDHPPSKIVGSRYQEEAHNLCVCAVLFHEQKYEEAHQKLIYRNFEYADYSIFADVILTKIYYVTNNDLFESRVSALSQKVRRSKLGTNNKAQYLNFIKMINQIHRYKWDMDEEKREKSKKRLTELRPIVEREWLSTLL